MKINKVNAIMIALGVMSSIQGQTQIQQAGFQLKYNFARHLVVQKNMPAKFARSVQNVLASPGGDLFADYLLNDKWSIRSKLGYEVKGFVGNFTPYLIEEESFKFRHISIDLNVQRYYGDGGVRFYNFLGVSTGYMLSHSIPDLEQSPGDYSLAKIEYGKFDNYRKFGWGLNVGLGINFDDFIWLELEYNRDISASIETTTVKEYNLIYGVQFGMNVLSFFRE